MASIENVIINKKHSTISKVKDNILINRHKLVLPVLFFSAVFIFMIFAPGFSSIENLSNVARQSVFLMIVSLGQLMVLIGRGLDLSVGTVVALSSVVGATVMASSFQAMPNSPYLAIFIGFLTVLVSGSLIGFINGIGAAYFRIPSFMMTLGMSSVIFGVTLMISGGVPVYGMPQEFGELFGYGRVFGIPTPVLITILIILLMYVLLEWTRFGRHLYATGGNERAAQLSGVRTQKLIIISFVISGALAAIAGLLLTARLDTGESNIGSSLPLESIAACVIAGAALSGGLGRTFAVVMGTLLIIVVQNGMNLMQVGAYAQTIVIGIILIVAMMMSKK